MPHAELLVVGDELVRGITADTNGPWLAARLAALGVAVGRITLLPDDVHAVADELRSALERQARLVVTTGGLGPTEDDRTLQAVARATGRRLELHPRALELVAGRYRALAEAGVLASAELTPQRRKMAILPQGAEPLPNEVGTAPGALLRLGGGGVASLPGVPAEMRPMWERWVEPVVRELFEPAGFAEATVVAACNDESELAPLLAQVAARHPGVYVKSRAAAFTSGGGLRVSLQARGAGEAGARAALEACLADLRRTLRGAGFGLQESDV